MLTSSHLVDTQLSILCNISWNCAPNTVALWNVLESYQLTSRSNLTASIIYVYHPTVILLLFHKWSTPANYDKPICGNDQQEPCAMWALSALLSDNIAQE